MNRELYPDNWEEIAFGMKQLTDWTCEHCGHAHDPAHGYTLTVHHLDGAPSNCAYENLVVLCQRCHLRVQAAYRPGMLVLPGMRPAWMVQRGLGV
jgi:5-methylcytosine-specific restriction endonuclease McrA